MKRRCIIVGSTDHDGTVSGVRVGGLLLTGGASRRLGIDKSTLLRDGISLADRSARALSGACDPVLEVGSGTSRLPVVREDPPGAGPLAAVVAGATALQAQGHAGSIIVLAVDLPYIESGVLAWLAGHPAPGTVVPRVGGEAQSLCARYSPDALAIAEQLVAEGEHSMRSLLAAAHVTYLDEDAWGDVCEASTFADIDTPDDLKHLETGG